MGDDEERDNLFGNEVGKILILTFAGDNWYSREEQVSSFVTLILPSPTLVYF
jgi:hypothetical protein